MRVFGALEAIMKGQFLASHPSRVRFLLGLVALALLLLTSPALATAACQNAQARRVLAFVMRGTIPQSKVTERSCSSLGSNIELSVMEALAKGQTEQARTDTTKFLSSETNYGRSRFWAFRLTRLARVPVSFRVAEAAYAVTVELEPRDSTFWYQRGDFYKQSKQPDKAVDSYRSGIAADSVNAAVGYMRLGTLFYESQSRDQALDMFRQAEQSDEAYQHLPKPQKALLYFYIGEIYGQGQQWDQSARYYERTLETFQAPGWPTYAAYLGIGRSALLQGDTDRAWTFYAKALDLTNNDKQRAVVYKEFGRWHTYVGDLEHALHDYVQASEFNPEDEWSYFAAAQLQEKMRQIPQAIANYQKALSINPKLAAAQDALRRLQNSHESNQ